MEQLVGVGFQRTPLKGATEPQQELSTESAGTRVITMVETIIGNINHLSENANLDYSCFSIISESGPHGFRRLRSPVGSRWP